MAHRRALECHGEARQRRQAERLGVFREIPLAQRPGQLPEVLEELQAVRPGEQFALLLVRVPREEELPGRPRLVDGGNDAASRARQPLGDLDDPAHHGVRIEALADLENRCGQRRRAVVRTVGLLRLRPLVRVGIVLRHGSLLPSGGGGTCSNALHQSFIVITWNRGIAHVSRMRARRICPGGDHPSYARAGSFLPNGSPRPDAALPDTLDRDLTHRPSAGIGSRYL